MERGFKSQAEKAANEIRAHLHLGVSDPLRCEVLAKALEVHIWSARVIPGVPAEILKQLLEADKSSWSAFTITHPINGTHIFYNPTHTQGRHESNVLHELSHLLCKHEPSKFAVIDGCGFSLRTCNPVQEKEATWVCGCLKLPRDSLLWAVRQGLNNWQIATHFITNPEMVQFRRNVTGVDRQFQNGRMRKKSK